MQSGFAPIHTSFLSISTRKKLFVRPICKFEKKHLGLLNRSVFRNDLPVWWSNENSR